MKVKIQEKVITLREECGLVTHLLILSKSRPGIIEFSELMKKHKFSVTPKLLFDPEGLLYNVLIGPVLWKVLKNC